MLAPADVSFPGVPATPGRGSRAALAKGGHSWWSWVQGGQGAVGGWVSKTARSVLVLPPGSALFLLGHGGRGPSSPTAPPPPPPSQYTQPWRSGTRLL